MAKVAVITRTKDRDIFLRRAIRSVSSQTYDDYVHVIVNDGGDKSVIEAVVNEFPARVVERIKVFHRTAPSNAPDTIFNESINYVASDYYAIHDDDDTWHAEFLKQTTDVMDAGAHAVVVRTDKVSEELVDGAIIEKKREHYLSDIRAINLYRQCIDNQLTPIATLIRRSSYEEVGGYDDTLEVAGDWEFGIRFLKKFDVAYLDPGYPLAGYHHRKYDSSKQGNTSYAGNDKAAYWSNYIMNKFLREELASGQLGVGYIMSKLRYDQHEKAEMVRRVLPKFLTSRLKKKIQG